MPTFELSYPISLMHDMFSQKYKKQKLLLFKPSHFIGLKAKIRRMTKKLQTSSLINLKFQRKLYVFYDKRAAIKIIAVDKRHFRMLAEVRVERGRKVH